MARQDKTLPARRQRPAVDDTLLIRSAESLGRMIGSLQRQLDGVSKRIPGSGGAAALFGMDGDARESVDGNRKGATLKSAATKKSAAGRASKGDRKAGAKKTQSTIDRKSKRASKSAVASKSAGRSRSGASRKSAKSGRRS